MHHRRSIRLKGYDYAGEGLYFITICTSEKQYLFGQFVDAQMQLSDIGAQAQKCWAEIPQHFPNVVLHEYVIMPNHVHGIIEIVGAKNLSPRVTDDSEFGTRANDDSPLRPNGTSKTVGSIIRGFKIGVTKFAGHSVWQRNYYEHIIRDYVDYLRIADYISDNPKNWNRDKFYDKNSCQ
jgi:putative transposase